MNRYYLGIDTGSVSVNFALIDKDKNVVRTLYLRNRGVIETVREGLARIRGNPEPFAVGTVGVTGSGRKLTDILVGGDVVKTEVLCHTIGTLNFIPGAKTVLEIGGEDSKLSVVRDAVFEDFSMNTVCGGGCGAMIEAIASRMGVGIDEVGDMALRSTQDVSLPGKCGIFCQSAVVAKLNMGIGKEDLLMGVCRALVKNYLAMLGKGKNLEPPYCFQGGTSLNRGLRKALEEELDHGVVVPPHAENLGAIGVAILAMESGIGRSGFKGFNLGRFDYRTKLFKCGGCENDCEVTAIIQNDRLVGFIGSRCDKWNQELKKRQNN